MREGKDNVISVGFSRNNAGKPVMLEKAYPTSEQVYYEDGPSMAEEAKEAGQVVFFDGMPGDEDMPQRRYSHSSGDL